MLFMHGLWKGDYGVVILTQETQVGEPAKELHVAKPNPMLMVIKIGLMVWWVLLKC